MTPWLDRAPKILLFTGKGGVGKTSLACASAVRLADAGRRVLLVSTDPASNLDEVLDTPLEGEPRPVNGSERLHALNIDPLEAAARYRARMVDPLRGVLPEESLRNIEEQLSGACTVEIAAFNEFTRLLGDDEVLDAYDHVVLDTAPTGHTLRLLALPAAWNDFIADNKTGSSCLGPLAGLKEQRKTYERALHVLRDADQTRVVVVSRPENGALREAARAAGELRNEGIEGLFLVINGLFEAGESDDPLAASWTERGRRSLDRMPASLRELPRCTRPFRPGGLIGLPSLRDFLNDAPQAVDDAPLPEPPSHRGLSELVDSLEADGPGVILAMGKGGVGKTTLAAAIARGLARRGHPVHLSTTDPAAHVAETLGEGLPNLEVDRIDPREETRRHVEHVLATAGADLDAAGRELLEEELRSPCTEEVAVFQAFARTVARGADRFVVLDTAPTGHTLLLLDASEAYHREVLRDRGELPDSVRDLLPKLRDPAYTRVLLVTLPEATPVHEAQRLQEDLRRAGLEPRGWILNQSLLGAGPSDPRLRLQAAREVRYLREAAGLAANLTIVPWRADEPVGPAGLDGLLAPDTRHTTRDTRHAPRATRHAPRATRHAPRDPQPTPDPPPPAMNLLFLCTGNSCRSQMAEGWTRALKSDVIQAYSAGIETHGLNPHAVKVMAEAGVDISGQRSQHIDEFRDTPLDVVVTVCDHAHETCPWFPAGCRVVHAGFEDPPRLARELAAKGASEEEQLEAYRRVRDAIRQYVESLPESLSP